MLKLDMLTSTVIQELLIICEIQLGMQSFLSFFFWMPSINVKI